MHRAFSRISSRLTASVTALTLSVGLSTALPTSAIAGQLDSKTTFLGLEGEGDKVQALADALRWELGQRGRDDGRTMSLAELEMTMGCGDDDIGCYAQGGQTLGSEELVYGTLTKTGAGWTVQLTTIDVAQAQVTKTVSRELTEKELTESAVAATAASLLNDLYEVQATESDKPPEEDDSGVVPPPPEDGVDEVEEKKEGGLIWGAYSPRPRWKLVGLGVTGGLTVAALGTAIGTTIAIGNNGPIRKDLLAAAQDSLDDDKPSNDIDPNSSSDLCQLARTPPDPSKPNEVTNASVTKVCIKADNVATAATVSWVATGVFAVATVAFTVLLFVHKDKPAASAMRKRNVRFGAAPVGGGGFMVGGGMNF
ncbi:hypothetical protein ACNOYE_07590 [Nannocystaceae bacterium ST9]